MRARLAVSDLSPIDLLHLGASRNVGVVRRRDERRPRALRLGPTPCIPALKAGLAERGLELGDIRHLLLSHIHFDHAGAAGALVREQPSLQVHVSEVGAPHLVDPSRLEASARRLYGDSFDTPLGRAGSRARRRTSRIVGDDVLGLECFPSTGHASHHVSLLHEDGTLYAGDSVGVRIAPGRFVLPPTPPPDIDLEAWERTIAATERRAPARLALTHFGVFEDVQEHLDRLRETLLAGASGSATGWTRRRSSPPRAPTASPPIPTRSTSYDRAAPYWQCFLGLERYWRKRRESAA